MLAGKISIGVNKISIESPALPHICRKLETERSLLPILGSLQQYNWNSWEQKQIIEQYKRLKLIGRSKEKEKEMFFEIEMEIKEKK